MEELAPGHSQVRMRLDQPRRQLLPGEDVERLIQFDIVPVVDARGCVAPQLLDQRHDLRAELPRRGPAARSRRWRLSRGGRRGVVVWFRERLEQLHELAHGLCAAQAVHVLLQISEPL